ncbi:hypothetical protein GGX14DRAFT_556128 [Mycena pura]|uniref:Uncharacterized protein n=1 Tax=Mycena pura TaxID=153505 RepID=A0AAD6YNY7_9AGAR|nr:hypothetical protein GGX14DRAFT_556128 [Mycena pura]
MASSSKFVYDTAFPEQGLSQALLDIVRPRIEVDKEIIGTNGLSATLHEVTLVAQVLYHFGVDEDDIPARMADMGMLEFYERMIAAGCCEGLYEYVPRRSRDETRPFDLYSRW